MAEVPGTSFVANNLTPRKKSKKENQSSELISSPTQVLCQSSFLRNIYREQLQIMGPGSDSAAAASTQTGNTDEDGRINCEHKGSSPLINEPSQLTYSSAKADSASITHDISSLPSSSSSPPSSTSSISLPQSQPQSVPDTVMPLTMEDMEEVREGIKRAGRHLDSLSENLQNAMKNASKKHNRHHIKLNTDVRLICYLL